MSDSKQSGQPEFSPRTADPNTMTSPMFVFVRKHWYASIKVVALFMILTLATQAFHLPDWVYAVFSVLCFFAWVYFDYSDTYRLAMRDYNLVKYNYLEYDKLRGLKSGLLAQIPGAILIVLVFVTKLGSANYSDFFRLLYFVLYSPSVMLISAVEQITPLIFLLPLAVVPVVSWIGYRNGYHNVGLLSKLIYRQRSKDKRLR